jgi:hypothetical protein
MHSRPSERRRRERLKLQISVFVRGFDAAGNEFVELTTPWTPLS